MPCDLLLDKHNISATSREGIWHISHCHTQRNNSATGGVSWHQIEVLKSFIAEDVSISSVAIRPHKLLTLYTLTLTTIYTHKVHHGKADRFLTQFRFKLWQYFHADGLEIKTRTVLFGGKLEQDLPIL